MTGSYYNQRAFGAGLGAMHPDSAMAAQGVIAPAPGDLAYQKAVSRDPLVGALLPQQVLARVQDVAGAVRQLMAMEEDAVGTANAFIAQHNARQVAASDYPKYDAFRHRVYNSQVAFHRAIRAAVYQAAGRTLGDQVMARIPWPTWLPAVRPETPRNVPPISAGGGAHGLGVAQFVLLGGAILAGLALITVALYFSTDIIDALQEVYLTRAQSRALDRLLEDRRQVYDQCIAQGGAPDQCAQVVNQAFSSADLDRFFRRTSVGRGSLWYVGLAVVLAGVGVAGWWAYKTFYKPKSSMHGLGAVRRLRSLNDSTPSKYMLEVDR